MTMRYAHADVCHGRLELCGVNTIDDQVLAAGGWYGFGVCRRGRRSYGGRIGYVDGYHLNKLAYPTALHSRVSAPVSPSKSPRRLPRKSARTERPSAYPPASMWGIDEGAEGPALYRHLVAELDKLGLAYVHVLHTGNEQLVGDIRARWKQVLIVNRPGRPRDQIGTDVGSGLADLDAYGQMVLANPDFVARLKTGAPMNNADRVSFFGGAAQGYTDYPALEAATAA
jgi:hypothetical protein